MICIYASAYAHDATLPTDSAHYIGHQAVGLVLSGGGAKGIAHIAVIKAALKKMIYRSTISPVPRWERWSAASMQPDILPTR